MGEDYRVDLGQLLAHVERCEQFDAKVQDWLDQIDAAIARLHASWSGEAATAQREQHDRWVKGAQEMREALARLREQAGADHQRYSGLVDHQRGMWP